MGQGFSWNPLVQPLHQRGPEPAYCGVTHPAGHGLGTCNLDQGHDGNHSSGLANWPQARSNYRSDQLTGAKIDDLILDLFRRVEQLEQGAANGAATDDMFASTNRSVEGLAGGMDRLTRRVRDLEKAAVYSIGPHDLSALQTNIENHINRALTEFGSVLNTQFERLNGAICTVNGEAQQRHIDTGAKLNAIWKVIGAMAPIIDTLGSAEHEWVNEPEPVTHVDTGLDYTTERASGSPAAVRCPERFREGQCLGYAGHDGDCSAVADGEQLEDPIEF